MSTGWLGRERWRGLGPALALLLAVACGAEAPGPVGEPLPGYEPPVRVADVDGTVVTNRGPAERLLVYSPPPPREATLLFMAGRAATPLEEGGSAWADLDGARVVRFDRHGFVSGVLGGAPTGEPPLTGPAFVALSEGAILAVETDGRALRFRGGDPETWVEPLLPAAAVGGAGGVAAASRTVFGIHLMPLQGDEPLLWVSDRSGVRSVGRIRMPEQAMLAPLVNAGWVAPSPDGSVVFASAVRPEVHRYGPDGEPVWVATWPRAGVTEPRFKAEGGTLMPDFRLIQQAVAIGPAGRIYVLGTSGSEGPADRLLVFERDGSLVREGAVATDAAIYIGPGGHVYTADPDAALARTERTLSAVSFEPFDLPALDGEGRVRLRDYGGKVVVLNFWASWCAPCRGEMPLLDALAGRLDPRQAVVLGLNEDVLPEDGLAFLDEIGGVRYPIAEGRGGLRDEYGYRGLPYTVVLDREGRLVRAIYGFGDSIDPLEEALTDALARGVP